MFLEAVLLEFKESIQIFVKHTMFNKVLHLTVKIFYKTYSVKVNGKVLQTSHHQG